MVGILSPGLSLVQELTMSGAAITGWSRRNNTVTRGPPCTMLWPTGGSHRCCQVVEIKETQVTFGI